jgi:hypothetical protein
MVELWLRNVASRLTFTTAAALGFMLLATTSSAGYAALAVYFVIMMLRAIIAPNSVHAGKVVQAVMLGLSAIVLVLLVFSLHPNLIPLVEKTAKGLTIAKAETVSGRQRLFFARKSFEAFAATWGFGVGAGSFRASGLILAILGSTGVIGLAAYAGHYLKILKPLRRDTYDLPGDPAKAIGVAAAWTACAGTIPTLFAAPTADPGYFFAIFGGLALGWRYLAQPARAAWRRPVAVQGAPLPLHGSA